MENNVLAQLCLQVRLQIHIWENYHKTWIWRIEEDIVTPDQAEPYLKFANVQIASLRTVALN